MRKIFKFKIPWFGDLLEIHKDAQIVSVAEQDEDLYLWAIVEVDAPMVKRWFRVVGTGHIIPDNLPNYHVGTIHTKNGYVWHIFETLRDDLR